MKKLNFLILVFAVSILSEPSKAIDTASIKYYPLAVGNVYVYNYARIFPSMAYTIKIAFMRDTIVNNKKYFLRVRIPLSDSIWLRTDTTTGSLYSYDPTNSCSFYHYETLVDSLAASINDFNNSCAAPYRCTSISTYNAFGLSWEAKSFYYYIFAPHASSSSETKFLKGIGLFSKYNQFWGFMSYSESSQILKGCIVNGIRYGDTSLVGVTNTSTEVPESFNISQNFPNPFNPSTKIRFNIATPSYVKLTVNDISGKIVELLLNEKLGIGSYEATWDGSNYPSGVYFYRMEAGEFVSEKKMILVK